MRRTLSLCMIVRDCSGIIERALASIIDQIDEGVVVDTGSDDETPEIVGRFFRSRGKNLKLLDFTPVDHPESFLLDVSETWRGEIPGPFSGKQMLSDFSAARQLGWDAATGDYKIWIDSDDIFEHPETIPAIIEQMEKDGLDCGLLNYDYSKDQYGNVNCRLIRERIFSTKRSKARWTQPVHEIISPTTNARLFSGKPSITHMRAHDGAPPLFHHRNLKILTKWWMNTNRAIETKDLRSLFYLGMEERKDFSEKALEHLDTYVERATWDEERALAYLLMGEIYERKEMLNSAYSSYALSAIDSPESPDGILGLARIACLKGNWARCVELTERAAKILEHKQHVQVLMHDPGARTWRPHVYYTRALMGLGRMEEALKACLKGLAMAPGEPNLLANKKTCEDHLAIKLGTDKKPTSTFLIKFDEPVDSPSKKIPPDVLEAMAIEMWKENLAANTVRALQLLDALPASISMGRKISEARQRTLGSLPEETQRVPTEKIDGIPTARPIQDAPVIVTPARLDQDAPVIVTPARLEERGKLKIIIWTGPAWERWSPDSLDSGGIGGSETAAICMARELARRGHDVTALADCAGQEGVYDGVKYVHFRDALNSPDTFKGDVFVCSRQAAALDLPFEWKASFLWVHDVHVGMPTTGPLHVQICKATKIFCLSKWHKQFFLDTYPFLFGDKVIVTRNGLDLKYFEKEPKKEGNRLIYSSSPDRGLERLLELLPEIRRKVPDAALDVYYGFENWKKMAQLSGNPGERTRVERLEKNLEDLSAAGVLKYHGRVNKQTLADAFLGSKVWTYPTWFTESHCISAIEAQAGGCVPVVTALAALTETVSHGFAISPPNTSADYGRVFINRVVKLLTNDAERERYAEAGRRYAFLNHGWDRVAEEWEKTFYTELAKKSAKTDAPKALDEPATEPTASPRIEVGTRKMRIATVLGLFSSSMHGNFPIEDLFVKRALTGSESCFFNTIKGLAELGHQVDAFCDTPRSYRAEKELAGAHVHPLGQRIGTDYDAFIAWNEPDQLREISGGKLRVCAQQLNDFGYCQPNFDEHVDLYVLPSRTHLRYLAMFERLDEKKSTVIANSVNIEMFDGQPVDRDPAALVWSSSPDRGLHVALAVFEKIREEIPSATFKIFYRFARWYEQVKDESNEAGQRARKIQEVLARMGSMGENGVFMLDTVPNVKLIEILRRSQAQLYTCDPIRFTEGFGVSIMDACAAGCLPIISNADALPEIYSNAAIIIPGPPERQIDAWVRETVRIMRDPKFTEEQVKRCRTLAKRHDRKIVAKQWEKTLLERLKS